ncbi:MAG: DNA replication and repair protein RecF, partial [Oscillospiraceae bacterium]
VINGVAKKTGSALVGKICAVIFSPEHLLLIKDGPAGRRSFIDGAICQINPGYPKLLTKYNRVIVQRNAMLREMQKTSGLEEMLEIWNERAVHFGTEIINKRIAYMKSLSPAAEEIYFGISGEQEEFRIDYKPLGLTTEEWQKSPEESYHLALKRSQKTDQRLGVTGFGPHRDDLEIFISGLSARIYGSQGQQRSAVIAMKLGEAEVLEKNIGEPPLILLDDVMSELDQKRQDYILNRLFGRQIFITCCTLDTLGLMKKGKQFHVVSGVVEEQKSEEKDVVSCSTFI